MINFDWEKEAKSDVPMGDPLYGRVDSMLIPRMIQVIEDLQDKCEFLEARVAELERLCQP